MFIFLLILIILFYRLYIRYRKTSEERAIIHINTAMKLLEGKLPDYEWQKLDEVAVFLRFGINDKSHSNME